MNVAVLGGDVRLAYGLGTLTYISYPTPGWAWDGIQPVNIFQKLNRFSLVHHHTPPAWRTANPYVVLQFGCRPPPLLDSPVHADSISTHWDPSSLHHVGLHSRIPLWSSANVSLNHSRQIPSRWLTTSVGVPQYNITGSKRWA